MSWCRIRASLLAASLVFSSSIIMLIPNSASAQAVLQPEVLEWMDLVPPEMRDSLALGQDPSAISHDGDGPAAQASPSETAIRRDLNGRLVRLPGFIVPLDGNETHVTEFLLVPFFGACIHVPPPPVNQIVHVYFPEGVVHDMLYDAIWIEGVLKAGLVESELAISGYSMDALKAELYDYEADYSDSP